MNGYDTIGECWGTHVYGWSCTPTRDMIFYTLGVMPAESGFTRARVVPRLGRLEWGMGSVPTPYGLLSVEADTKQVVIDSPVPVLLYLGGQAVHQLPQGRHAISVQ